jgi:serine protease Do
MENPSSLTKPGFAKLAWVTCALLFFFFLVLGFYYFLGRFVQPSRSNPFPTSGSLADSVEKVAPSVVNVVATRLVDSQPWLEMDNGRNGSPQPEDQKQKSRGFGAGFIIDRQGTIVTNEHVIQSARVLKVLLASGEEYPALLAGSDKETDLALLRIKPKAPLTPAQWGNSDELRVGDWVFAVGNPYNYNHSVTVGIVSAKDRIIEGQPFEQFIQTDAAINFGNSGGPLFNVRGEVVGIATAISTRGKDIGFAIPANHALPILRQLDEQGRVRRGYLGIRPRTVSSDLAQFLRLPSPVGVIVEDLAPESGAARAGVKRYDVLTKMDGYSLKTSQEFFARISGIPSGKRIQLEIFREGKTRRVEATVQERASSGKTNFGAETQSRSQPTSRREAIPWGVAVQELPEVYRGLNLGGGVFISAVLPFSPAAEAELLPGDILLEINRIPVTSLQEYRANILKLKQEPSLLLLVSRPSSGTRIVLLKREGLLP